MYDLLLGERKCNFTKVFVKPVSHFGCFPRCLFALNVKLAAFYRFVTKQERFFVFGDSHNSPRQGQSQFVSACVCVIRSENEILMDADCVDLI